MFDAEHLEVKPSHDVRYYIIVSYIIVGKSKKAAKLVFVEGKQYSAAILHKKIK